MYSPSASRISDISGAATSVERFESTVAPTKAPMAPGMPILATTFQSTLPNFQCETAGDQGGADLGEVDGGRGGGGVGADGEQEGGGGDAVGHAEAAVDELGDEADKTDEDESFHVGCSMPWDGRVIRTRVHENGQRVK